MLRRKLWLSKKKKDMERKRWAGTQIDAAFHNFLSLRPSPWDDKNQQARDGLLGRMMAIAKATGFRDDRDMVNTVAGWYGQHDVQPDALAVTASSNEWVDEWNAR